MGFGGAFKIFGKAIAKGLKETGKTIARIDDIPGAKTVLAIIPVAGPVLGAAVKRAGMAEDMFSSGEGSKKRQWAEGQLRKDLRRLGVQDKNIRELISLGILVVMKSAIVKEEKPEKEKPSGKAVGARRGRGRLRKETEAEPGKTMPLVSDGKTAYAEPPPPGGEQPPT